MSDGVLRDTFLEGAVSAILDAVAKFPTIAEADVALAVARAQISEKIRVLRDDEHNPEVAALFERLLGRLLDATETGGTRR